MIFQLPGVQGKVVRENVRHVHIENERSGHEGKNTSTVTYKPRLSPSPSAALKSAPHSPGKQESGGNASWAISIESFSFIAKEHGIFFVILHKTQSYHTLEKTMFREIWKHSLHSIRSSSSTITG